jgi:CTP:molybdopterin cytidylyltransferase MocA
LPDSEPNSEASSRGIVLVLAAGRGTRMGRPKALMEVGGRPWWRVQQDRLVRCGRPPVWMVGSAVRTALSERPDAPPRMIDADSASPMFMSVLAGVLVVRSEQSWAFLHILPVDVPTPAFSTFERLESAAGDGVAVPLHEGATGHPVCLSRQWIERVLIPASVAGQPERLRLDLLTAPDRTILEVDDADVVTNLNTPDDVARWLSRTSPTLPGAHRDRHH